MGWMPSSVQRAGMPVMSAVVTRPVLVRALTAALIAALMVCSLVMAPVLRLYWILAMQMWMVGDAPSAWSMRSTMRVCQSERSGCTASLVPWWTSMTLGLAGGFASVGRGAM